MSEPKRDLVEEARKPIADYGTIIAALKTDEAVVIKGEIERLFKNGCDLAAEVEGLRNEVAIQESQLDALNGPPLDKQNSALLAAHDELTRINEDAVEELNRLREELARLKDDPGDGDKKEGEDGRP